MPGSDFSVRRRANVTFCVWHDPASNNLETRHSVPAVSRACISESTGLGKSLLRWLGAAAGIALLAGCMVGPDFKQPEVLVNEQWRQETGTPFSAAVETVRNAQINAVQWWSQFEDPTLDELLKLAAQQNLSLQSAAVRIYQARAQLGVSDATLLPTVVAAGSAIGGNNASTKEAMLQANWEIDFWGKYRRGIESTFAGYQGAIAAYYAADVSLASMVARTYINIRNLESLIRVARTNLALQGESLRIADARYKAGSTSLLALSQAQTRYQQTKAEIPQLISRLNRQQNAMSALLGQTPSFYEVTFGGIKNQLKTPEVLNVGIPKDLLRRRPDVALAEYQAVSQSALIGVREADLYPSFSLTGMFGYLNASVSYTGGQTFSFEGSSGSGGGGFYFPLFYRGAIVDQVRVQDAAFQQALLNYQNTVLAAQAEVEDALVQIATAKQASIDYARAARSAAESAKLALDLYEAGQSDYNTVIVAQQILLRVQTDLVQTRTNALLGYVDAFKALGGGWSGELKVPPLPSEMVAQMKERTDWGQMLNHPETPRLIKTLGLDPTVAATNSVAPATANMSNAAGGAK
ncbi:efflux transporter outer membrane subunit [Orrella daihaiensis]|uniref:Efflux transporter outer membrane subunit n=1 Tax=Orrella daihaiensis TaxID=2782176 RepID=A0ABY4AHG0_9BURK|nr:efflux transporter outer membrane subunit [Orrella daihaiensis]